MLWNVTMMDGEMELIWRENCMLFLVKIRVFKWVDGVSLDLS